MKKIILLLLIIPAFSHAQKMSCCKQSTTEQFVMFAANDAFASMHLAPVPLNFIAEKGAMISFECSDGTKGNGFEINAAKKSDVWLFVFHEWWGLNDYIKREAERFSNELPGVNILAIDLYDGNVAETSDQAQEFMKGVKDERARSIIKGALSHAGSNAKIGTIGWCFGGGWSLQTAIMNNNQAVACVMYYGMPENDVEKLKTLNTDVLGIFATKDAWLTPEVVTTFEKNMKAADKKTIIKSYDADHAFANPSNPKYDKVSSEDAHKHVLEYLKSRVK